MVNQTDFVSINKIADLVGTNITSTKNMKFSDLSIEDKKTKKCNEYETLGESNQKPTHEIGSCERIQNKKKCQQNNSWKAILEVTCSVTLKK